MKRPIGFILILLGSSLMGLGIFGALREMKTLYTDTIERPLDAMQEDGKAVSNAMLTHVGIGMAGAPLFAIGLFLWKFGRPRKQTR